MTTEPTLQECVARLPVPSGFRAVWKTPTRVDRIWSVGEWVPCGCDWEPSETAFVLVPLFTPPQWLVESDYVKIFNDGIRWYMKSHDNWIVPADLHHDLRDMLKDINPKVTPVAWERGK